MGEICHSIFGIVGYIGGYYCSCNCYIGILSVSSCAADKGVELCPN